MRVVGGDRDAQVQLHPQPHLLLGARFWPVPGQGLPGIAQLPVADQHGDQFPCQVSVRGDRKARPRRGRRLCEAALPGLVSGVRPAELHADVARQRLVRDGPLDEGGGVLEAPVAAEQVDVLDLQRGGLPPGGLLLSLADRRVGSRVLFQEVDQFAGRDQGRR